MHKKESFATIAVTGGFRSDEQTGVTNIPLYLSNAYQFKDADSAANLFNLEEAGYIYTRMHNPTTDLLETRLAALEGGIAAVATSTGHFAELLTILCLCKTGDEFIATNRLYGGTHNLFANSLKKLGITAHIVDYKDVSSWEKLINEKTKAIYLESLANPDSSIPDFDAIATLGKKHKLPIIVDNTVATPYLFKPVNHGANIVIHSTTKYLVGNNNVMGGIVIDLGNFDWKGSGRFPELTTPHPSYHGKVFTDTFGNAAFAAFARTIGLRDLGGTPSPFNSYLTLLGIQTLHLRMERHVENATKVIEFLSKHPSVEEVVHPSLPVHSDHALAKKYFPKGSGALLAIKVKGGYENAKKFVENVELCIHAVNIGDARTVLTHPASTTHRQCTEEQLKLANIDKSTIRISVGIEDADDIIRDLKSSLDSLS